MEGIHMPEGGKKGKYKRIGVKIGTVVMVMQVVSILLVTMICIFTYDSLIQRCRQSAAPMVRICWPICLSRHRMKMIGIRFWMV